MTLPECALQEQWTDNDKIKSTACKHLLPFTSTKLVVTCVAPYQISISSTNLTTQVQFQINNIHEILM